MVAAFNRVDSLAPHRCLNGSRFGEIGLQRFGLTMPGIAQRGGRPTGCHDRNELIGIMRVPVVEELLNGIRATRHVPGAVLELIVDQPLNRAAVSILAEYPAHLVIVVGVGQDNQAQAGGVGVAVVTETLAPATVWILESPQGVAGPKTRLRHADHQFASLLFSREIRFFPEKPDIGIEDCVPRRQAVCGASHDVAPVHLIEDVVAPQHTDDILRFRRKWGVQVPPAGTAEGVGHLLAFWVVGRVLEQASAHECRRHAI